MNGFIVDDVWFIVELPGAVQAITVNDKKKQEQRNEWKGELQPGGRESTAIQIKPIGVACHCDTSGKAFERVKGNRLIPLHSLLNNLF